MIFKEYETNTTNDYNFNSEIDKLLVEIREKGIYIVLYTVKKRRAYLLFIGKFDNVSPIIIQIFNQRGLYFWFEGQTFIEINFKNIGHWPTIVPKR